ncbi:MAG: hypothetical protein KAS90_05245 [Candidatus Aenigmarchaeota archaeon]|nr:hypothetical protein [Candidatus Aenigmarchaeota archaeon]
MSEEYIIFAGSAGGLPDFNQALGYIKHMVDQDILKNVRALEVWDEEAIDVCFYDDFNIKGVLLGIDNLPKRYTVFRAEVLDHEAMEDNLEKMSNRYPDLKHEFYAKDPESIVKMKRHLSPLIDDICNRKDTKVPAEDESMIF